MGNDERAHTKFPQSGRGLRHVTLELLACDRTYLQKLFELVTSNLVSSLDCQVLHTMYGLLFGSGRLS